MNEKKVMQIMTDIIRPSASAFAKALAETYCNNQEQTEQKDNNGKLETVITTGCSKEEIQEYALNWCEKILEELKGA